MPDELDGLDTEGRLAAARRLDQMSTREQVQLMSPNAAPRSGQMNGCSR